MAAAAAATHGSGGSSGKQSDGVSAVADNQDDPVDRMIERTGCATQHAAVQFCFADTRDWRKCQKEVGELKLCMDRYQKVKAASAAVASTAAAAR